VGWDYRAPSRELPGRGRGHGTVGERPRPGTQPWRTGHILTRRGEEEITFEWLAEQLRTFVDLNPDFEVPVERLATWLARLDDEDDDI
jgi:hypothetical protein